MLYNSNNNSSDGAGGACLLDWLLGTFHLHSAPAPYSLVLISAVTLLSAYLPKQRSSITYLLHFFSTELNSLMLCMHLTKMFVFWIIYTILHAMVTHTKLFAHTGLYTNVPAACTGKTHVLPEMKAFIRGNWQSYTFTFSSYTSLRWFIIQLLQGPFLFRSPNEINVSRAMCRGLILLCQSIRSWGTREVD